MRISFSQLFIIFEQKAGTSEQVLIIATVLEHVLTGNYNSRSFRFSGSGHVSELIDINQSGISIKIKSVVQG